jgi:8-oxo-dGTP pyrophosphatase MutT (NUDIX family)
MDRQLEVSSGGVIYRKLDQAIEVALARARQGPVWCLPKGRVEASETLEEAAVREVREETGLRGTIVGPIRSIEYTYSSRLENGGRTPIDKTVHFFLLLFEEGSVEDHDGEVLDVKWFPLNVAGRLLYHAGERDVLAHARKMLLGE